MPNYDLSRNNGLRWPFESWGDNGQVYLHQHNWAIFKHHKEYKDVYKHNWLHKRYFFHIWQPRDSLEAVANRGDIYLNHKIQCVEENLSVIWEPYPAHVNDNIGPSWHIWTEDKHPHPTYGEPIVLMSTEDSIIRWNLDEEPMTYALFRKQYWMVGDFKDLGLGPHPPSDEERERMSKKPNYHWCRNIDDE